VCSGKEADMGVSRQVLKEGNKKDFPKPGDTVAIEYTGYLYDASRDDKKGKKFDSSVGRGDFVTKIGRGKVIKGWDEGVLEMSVGEKSILTITSDYAYGDRGFPGHIPPGSSLVFDVELKRIL
jgi:FK506-binding protein 1